MRKCALKPVLFLIFISSILSILECFFIYSDIATIPYLSLIIGVQSIVYCVMLHYFNNYQIMFYYKVIFVLINTTALVILYHYGYGEIQLMATLITLHFTIPCFLDHIHRIIDRNERTLFFNQSFHCGILLFLVYYLTLLTYMNLLHNYGNSTTVLVSHNYIPFYTIADHIERAVYQEGLVKDIGLHLVFPVVLLFPYGFFTACLFHKRNRMIRLLSLLFLPILVELLQVFVIHQFFNIDDILYGILGGIIGQLYFYLLNCLSLYTRRISFLDSKRNYYGYLH